MKKMIVIIFALFTLCAAQDIQAKGVVVYHNGPKFETLKELPADVILEGKHVNVGVAYDQFGIFWLPLWNYGTPEYSLVSDDEETAWALTSEDIEAIKKEYNIELPENPSPSLWNKIGLKPIVILFIVWVLWGYFRKEKTDETVA
ncbi:hypothetical protein G7050_02205 [Dysgonomonas sp. HDW5A]|uniref:hypothetical protein n=1 Tax=unclassified Dysgonomonas TaxID=2630389 RepID=UPI0014074EF4|nr:MULTISPECIES: hypothetical protein [unclassified Dysgonomonas]QIK53299.1 hypothetical protein G7051_02610 [Dysgonomonas sp. HDW5B]QIK58716.1 hypothetical protein G7050_02205 [Dysgonomonas sp. HDW5A]